MGVSFRSVYTNELSAIILEGCEDSVLDHNAVDLAYGYCSRQGDRTRTFGYFASLSQALTNLLHLYIQDNNSNIDSSPISQFINILNPPCKWNCLRTAPCATIVLHSPRIP